MTVGTMAEKSLPHGEFVWDTDSAMTDSAMAEKSLSQRVVEKVNEKVNIVLASVRKNLFTPVNYGNDSQVVTGDIYRLLMLTHTLDVNIPQPESVRDYLFRNSDIVCFIPIVTTLVKESFQTNASLSLEVYRDHECDDEYLALYVRQENYEKGFMDKIDAIFAQYEDLLLGKKGWFIVTTDFRRPNKRIQNDI